MTVRSTDFLPHIEEIARLAGAVLMRHFRKLDGYEKKGAIDLQTIADRESEELVIAEILRRFPDHAILGEEGGTKGNAASEFLWVVDPLDGTTNYAHGLRIFAVSIGLTYRGELLAGAVLAPALDEMYLAAAGAGATLNGRKLHVSKTRDLEDALLVTGFPYNRAQHADLLCNLFKEAMIVSRGVVRLGAASLDFAAVAAGHLEAFYEYGLKPWDMSAGVLLVREAGGRVTGFVGDEPWDLFVPRAIASNGLIHAQLQETLLRGGSERLPWK